MAAGGCRDDVGHLAANVLSKAESLRRIHNIEHELSLSGSHAHKQPHSTSSKTANTNLLNIHQKVPKKLPALIK